MSTIKVTINGNDVKLINSSNVSEMLAEREIVGKMFVVEKNKKIVPKENYIQTPILENDAFEIVGFFGGG